MRISLSRGLPSSTARMRLEGGASHPTGSLPEAKVAVLCFPFSELLIGQTGWLEQGLLMETSAFHLSSDLCPASSSFSSLS